MVSLKSKLGLRILGLLVLFLAALWLWNAGKRWLAEHGLREIYDRLGARIVSVTPSPTVVVQRLQALNRLETARFISQHVVEAKSESPWLPSFLAGERLLLVAQVEVIAGLDMKRISPDDIEVKGDEVVVTLPPPKILSIRIDESKTQVFAREKGWLVFNPNKDLEREARLQALNEARRAAMESQLLPFARQKAEENLKTFLQTLGFKRVEIRWRTYDETAKRGEVGNG
ncbi:MAG: DUF4230 domain-containing protein [Armatimonadota bacterium]|nr:DUF4230 domain-containing protein [Armatimonadota bacterium]MDW8143889.1 DUF4230 domain-containing protein [Armatimonadota bacterium]